MATRRVRRLPPDERRDELVRLGLEMLGQRAYDQVSVAELAEAAGISKGLLYRYFPTKSHFVVAVLRHARGELDTRLMLGADADPVAWLDTALEGVLAYVEERAAGFVAIIRARGGDDPLITAELDEVRRVRLALLGEFAARLAGVDRAALESPALRAALGGWLAFFEEVVLGWLTERRLERGQVRIILRQALLGALAAPASVDATAASARLGEAAARAAATP